MRPKPGSVAPAASMSQEASPVCPQMPTLPAPPPTLHTLQEPVTWGGWDASRLEEAPCDQHFPSSSAPPTIWGSNETSEVAVMEGHPVRFLCEARGVPTPNITWFKDGVPLPLSAEAVYTRGGRQLQLERARGLDAGTYTCKASNPVGVAEKTTRLEVYGERWAAGVGSGGGGGLSHGGPVFKSRRGKWPGVQGDETEAREKGHLSLNNFPLLDRRGC